MSRRSVFSIPGIELNCHVFPPSTERPTVPLVPLTHTTLSEGTLSPRNVLVTRVFKLSMRCARMVAMHKKLKIRNDKDFKAGNFIQVKQCDEVEKHFRHSIHSINSSFPTG